MSRPSFGGAKGEEGRFRSDVAQAFAKLSAQIAAGAPVDLTSVEGRLDVLETPAVRVRADRSGSAQALTAGAAVQLIYNSEQEDTDAAYDNTTGVFTAPADGWYFVSAAAAVTYSGTAKVGYIAIKVNDIFRAVQAMALYGTDANYGVVSVPFYLAAGATVKVVVSIDSTAVGPSLVAATYSQLAISSFTGFASGSGSGSSAWTDITGKPTTLSGFGITDAYTETEVDTLLAGVNGGDPLAIHVDTTDMDVLYTANCAGSPSGATTSLSLNSLRVVPFVAPARGGTIDQIGVQITSGTALSNIRLGVYESKAFDNLYPGALLFDSGDISSASGGVKTAACSIDLEPGRVYWLAILGSHTVSCYGFAAANASSLLGVDPANYSTSIGFRSKAQAFGALPDPAPAALAVTGGNVPRLSYRFSA